MDTKQVMNQLTTEEKARLLSGVGSWHTYDCNGKLPAIMMSDGPHGLRKQEKEDFSDINRSEIATCFPTASAVASSWNTEAVAKMATAIAREALKEKVSIVLGCGTNIKRSPLCGRNFEYFSEDPFLSGTLATAYINAMQEQGVGTSLKHFAGNSQETRRQTSNSQIDERALREIYLSAFEMAVKEAKPTTIMASYNRLNGKYACANERLLTDILRNEWGYEGAVVSDWGATVDVVSCIKAGMDLEMPDSRGYHTQQVLEALDNGTLTVAEVDRAVEKVVDLILSQSAKIEDATVDYAAQHEIARELACESAVLLQNDGMLPLQKGAKVLVIGELAEHMRFQGGGSSHITTAEVPNAIESLRKKGMEVLYAQGYRSDYTESSEGKRACDNATDAQLAQEALTLAKEDIPILFFGGLTDSTEGEGYDRISLSIPSCQISLLNQLYEVNKDISFVSFGGAPMEMPFAGKVRAILHMYLGGQAVGEACADLLVGDVNPSGKLAETFPLSVEDVPCRKWYAPDSDDVEYRESIFVGYRYYDTFGTPALFHFGHGLSYTKFEYRDIQLSEQNYAGGSLQVSFTIKNVGTCAGKEIAQIYVVNPKANYARPKKELRGFIKVALEAGESKRVSVHLNQRSFSLYDVESGTFVMPTGTYEVLVGASLQDIRLNTSVEVKGITYTRDDRENLSDYFYRDENNSSADKTSTDKSFDIRKEQFIRLYGRPLSRFDQVEKGHYAMCNSFDCVSQKSLLGKIVRMIVLRILYGMNKDKPKDDPAVKMLVQGVIEGTLECLICASDGMFPPSIAEALVLAANGHSIKAIGRLMSSRRPM